MFSHSRSRLAFLAAAAVVAATACGLVFAAKGGGGHGGGGSGGGDPPPPTPHGTIYFTMDRTQLDGAWDIWSMDGDGNNKAITEDFVTPSSSNLLYGDGYRWSLEVRETGAYGPVRVYDDEAAYDAGVLGRIDDSFVQRDLYAVRSDDPTIEIPLTDLFGEFRVSNWGLGAVSWSNDGQDSFISFAAEDWRDAFGYDDPEDYPYLILANRNDVIVRIEHGGADILEAYANNLLPATANEVDVVVSSDDVPAFGGGLIHTWSRDGNKIAYLTHSATDNNAQLWVKDLDPLTGGAGSKIVEEASRMYWPRWQPTILGSQITFFYGGTIYTVDPDGSNYGALVPPVNSTVVAYPGGVWSPDGEYLVYCTLVKGSMGNDKYYLDRIDVLTGEVVRLTSDLDRRLGKSVVGWFSKLYATAGP